MIQGSIVCQGCGNTYPVYDGIPNFLPNHLTADDAHEDTTIHKRNEIAARDAQVEDYDKMWHLNLFGTVEIPMMHINLQLERDHLLLEGHGK